MSKSADTMKGKEMDEANAVYHTLHNSGCWYVRGLGDWTQCHCPETLARQYLDSIAVLLDQHRETMAQVREALDEAKRLPAWRLIKQHKALGQAKALMDESKWILPAIDDLFKKIDAIDGKASNGNN